MGIGDGIPLEATLLNNGELKLTADFGQWIEVYNTNIHEDKDNKIGGDVYVWSDDIIPFPVSKSI